MPEFSKLILGSIQCEKIINSCRLLLEDIQAYRGFVFMTSSFNPRLKKWKNLFQNIVNRKTALCLNNLNNFIQKEKLQKNRKIFIEM